MKSLSHKFFISSGIVVVGQFHQNSETNDEIGCTKQQTFIPCGQRQLIPPLLPLKTILSPSKILRNPPSPPSPVIRNDWPLNVNVLSADSHSIHPGHAQRLRKINKGLLSNCFNSLWLRQISNLPSFSPTLVIALIVKFVI